VVHGGFKSAAWARHTRDQISECFSMTGSGSLLVGTAQKVEKTGCEEVWRDVCHGLAFEGTVGVEDREDRINLKR
jgi:hypothetical protein